MRIAISGSSGLIGTALREKLAARGDEVVRIVRSNPGPSDALWDIHGGTIDAEALAGVDAVVHLAGAGIGDSKWSDDYKRELIESRTLGTALLAETIAALDPKPAVFVSGSAIGYYGDRGNADLREQDPQGSGFLAELVVDWESAAGAAVEAGIRTAFIRTGIVLSGRGGALKEQLPFFKMGVGGKIGDGTQYWSWISIDDQVDAILHIIETETLSGPVNLTAPNPTTNAEFTKALGKALGRPTFLPTPRFALDLRLGKEAVDEMLYASAKVLPGALTDSGFTFTHPTIDQALDAVL